MAAANEWNAELRPDSSESLAFEKIGGQKPKRRYWRYAVLGTLLGLLLAGAGGLYMFLDDMLVDTAQNVPIIRADTTPTKVRPDDPGGMEIPNRDKLVYERMNGAPAVPRVERLLPPPEVPKPPPEPEAAEPTAETPELIPTAEIPAEEDVAAVTPPPEQPAPKALTPSSGNLPAGAPKGPVETQAPAPEVQQPAAAEPKAEAASPPVAATAPATADQNVFRVQIAAVRSAEAAESEWKRLSKAHEDLLGKLDHSVSSIDLGSGKGVFYRLRTGAVGDETAAGALCDALKKRKVGCLLVRPE